ncbi:hypothetical protein AVEN_41795-1 [Araneus ventricosus]|uniref:Uncharacterized protein n=1 Tax=Araneus ventricosus TaxID=182803 RepID=A0A4Y2ACG3_ARAVE|nr:hypothetical protein AVEN_41795-1 [Araneus ventricosus]
MVNPSTCNITLALSVTPMYRHGQSMTYVKCDKDELIEDKLLGANLNDDEVIPPFFRDAMDNIEKFELVAFVKSIVKKNLKNFI